MSAFFIIFETVVIVILIFLFVILSWVWPPDSPWSPWWKTTKEVARIMCKMVKIGKKDIAYDLGSGEGTALIVAAKEFGIKKGVGVEIEPFRVLLSRFLVWKNGVGETVGIRKENFFSVDISEATVVFLYLVPKALRKLIGKFEQELKPGTRIISYRYKLDLPLIAENKEHKIYVYKMPTIRVSTVPRVSSAHREDALK